MEKLQASQLEEQDKLAAIEAEQTHTNDQPVQLASMQEFLKGLRKLAESPQGAGLRAQIVQLLIQKVEIFPSSFKLHYIVGRNYIDRELASAGSLFLSLIQGISTSKTQKSPGENPSGLSAHYFSNNGSNSACNGWGGKIGRAHV